MFGKPRRDPTDDTTIEVTTQMQLDQTNFPPNTIKVCYVGKMGNPSVAVIGAGAAGLAMLKNLKEEGIDNVVVFEKRESVGGIWAVSDQTGITSTMPSTKANVSKFTNVFTDFPMRDDVPIHPNALEICDYLKDYATHFNLHEHVKLNTSIVSINRNSEDTKWQVCTNNAGVEATVDFDKVAICTGLTAKPVTPHFEGIEDFEGNVIHAQAFRRPRDFPEQRVLVVGSGNSAMDTSTELIGHAKKIYLSHRQGAKILPRMLNESPLDLVVTRQKNFLKFFLDNYIPSLSDWLMDYATEQFSKQAFKLDDSWRFSPAPSIANHLPVVSDNLVPSLWAGDITSVYGLKRFIGRDKVELLDGSILEVDAVILCTGYEPDFSLPSDFTPFEPNAGILDIADTVRFARLYQNIFSPRYADSLAYTNYIAISDGAIAVADLMAMAIVQIWKGACVIPTEQQMNIEIDKQHEWLRGFAESGGVYTGAVRPGPWYSFLNRAAGTGVDESLGYGLEGWKFWWRERRLCGLMMAGVNSPHIYRFFDGLGKRKTWSGAREAIIQVNRAATSYQKVA